MRDAANRQESEQEAPRGPMLDPVALLRAAADLVKEHPEMAKYARALS